MNQFRSSRTRVGLFVFLLATLAACSAQPERLWLKAPGWSRAQLIGSTRVRDPVWIAFDEDENIYVLMIASTGTRSMLELVAYDRGFKTLWTRTYEEILLTRPAEPRILWNGEAIYLFWLDSAQLFFMKVSKDGNTVASPALLSGEKDVADYDLALLGDGGIYVWYAGGEEEPGLFALTLREEITEATLIDPEGIWPDVHSDDAGTLHALWARYPSGSGDKPFLYAAYPEGHYQPGMENLVAAARVVGTTVLEPPRLGLDGQFVYILWSKTAFSGLEAGRSETNYVFFPQGGLTPGLRPRLLRIPYSHHLTYQDPVASPLDTGARVPITSDFQGGNVYITQVETNPTAELELVIAFHTRVGYLMRKTQSQVATVYFKNGNPVGYQLLSFTSANSIEPSIISDQSGKLYMIWLEKGDLPGWSIYMASTAPDIEESVAGVSWDDLYRLGSETSFGLLSGALLLPVALIWVVPGMVVLGLTSLFRKEEAAWATKPGALISLLVAIISYWIMKIGVLPGISEYVPFSAWIPFIPDRLAVILRWGVPVFITSLSLLVAWVVSRRREHSSIYVFMILYAIIDSVLTMALYGVLVYAAF